MTAKDKYSCYIKPKYEYTEEQCLQGFESAIQKKECKGLPKYNNAVWQMLHCACQKGYMSVVKRILTAPNLGINNAKNNKRQTLLITALEAKQTEVVLLLLSHPQINVNKCGGSCKWATPFSFAISCNNIELVMAFLDKSQLDINMLSRLNTPTELHRYLFGGDNEEELFWRKRLTALDVAISGKRIEIIELLLERPELDVRVGNPFYHAFRLEDKRLFERLCARGDMTDETIQEIIGYWSNEMIEKNNYAPYEYVLANEKLLTYCRNLEPGLLNHV
jgi:Ankyrin repeats (3 copies)